MKIAIVILNWNGKNFLQKYLPSVVAYSKEASIYVIDNNSKDDSINFIKKNYPKIKCILLASNLGFTGGYNAGLKKVKAELFCLLNSDVRVSPNWLNPIATHFKTHPNTAIAQPSVLMDTNPIYFEYAGAAGGFLDNLGYPFCRGRIFDTVEKNEGQYAKNAKIFWACGSCFFIRKEVFETLGGFDNSFFAHQEEIDLCWRAQNKGYDVFFIANSRVYHLGKGTLRESHYKMYLNFRNSLFTLLKNLPTKKLFPILFYRLVADGIGAIYFLLKLNIKEFFAVLRAHFVFYLSFYKIYKKRLKTDRSQNVNYFYLKNINYKYRIQGKKNFLEL